MKIKRAVYREAKRVTAYQGWFGYDSSLNLQLVEAYKLLHEAEKLVANLGETTTDNDTLIKCRYWIDKFQEYLDERVRCLESGDDWRKGE